LRIARIRKRVFAATGATFALAWGVIFVQLVAGHDPALAKHTSASTTTTSVTTTSSGSSSASSGSGSTGTGGSASTGASTTSPVTTSQS
jgi:cytoskeletal protein RodZ